MKTIKALSIFAVVLMMVGCTQNVRMGQFTAASTMNVRNLEYSIDNQTEASTEGESCLKTYLFFTFGERDDRLQRAMDDSIKNGRKNISSGDLLVNVRVDHSISTYPFYMKNCVKVKGDLVSITK